MTNPDFEKVSAKLDSGGDFFMFMGFRGALNEVITKLEPVFAQADNPVAQRVPAAAREIINALGLDQLNDFGLSVVALDNGMRRMKAFLAFGTQSGLLAWLGKPGGELDSLSLVPQDAIIAWVERVSFDGVLPMARAIAHAISPTEGEAKLKELLGESRTQGVDLEKIIASLGDEYGLFVTLDPKHPIAAPTGSDTVPRPQGLFMIRTKDDTLYRTVVQLIKTNGGKMEPAEGVPAGFEGITEPAGEEGLRWIIAKGEGRFMIATHVSQMTDAAAARTTKSDVRSQPAYKALQPALPAKADGVFFVSPRVQAELDHALTVFGDKEGIIVAKVIEALLGGGGSKDKAWGRLTYRVNEPDGILWVTCGDVHISEAAQAVMVVPVAILAAIAVPNFLEAQVRAKVSRTKSDMRSMATALEAYYVDYNAYPACTADPQKSALKGTARPGLPSFNMQYSPGGAGSLTTPIAYVTTYFPDVFAPDKGDTFAYYNPKPGTNGWILISPGPDGKYDLDWTLYDPTKPQPSAEILQYCYDPTNGTVSAGDVFRVKQ